MENVITYQPKGSKAPKIWDYGTNYHAKRKREARRQLEQIKDWDNRNRPYYFSPCYDPQVMRTFQSMPLDQFQAMEREHYLSLPIHEITREEYWDALECLPPIYCGRAGGDFLMREMWTGTFTYMYRQIGNRYFSKMVDAADRTTWNWTPEEFQQ